MTATTKTDIGIECLLLSSNDDKININEASEIDKPVDANVFVIKIDVGTLWEMHYGKASINSLSPTGPTTLNWAMQRWLTQPADEEPYPWLARTCFEV